MWNGLCPNNSLERWAILGWSWLGAIIEQNIWEGPDGAILFEFCRFISVNQNSVMVLQCVQNSYTYNGKNSTTCLLYTRQHPQCVTRICRRIQYIHNICTFWRAANIREEKETVRQPSGQENGIIASWRQRRSNNNILHIIFKDKDKESLRIVHDTTTMPQR